MIGLSHLSDEQLLVSLGFIMERFRHHTRSVPQMLARIMLVEPTTVSSVKLKGRLSRLRVLGWSCSLGMAWLPDR